LTTHLSLNLFWEFHSYFRSTYNTKKVIDDIDLEDLSSESSEEEAGGEGEFDFKWMRLKVPLAAQDPSIMRTMVNKGKELDE